MSGDKRIRAALLLREYAADDDLRADDDESYSDGTHAESLRKRANEARETANDLDPQGANA